MNCPRCKTPVGPLPDPDSIVTCPGCGSRLMTRSAALRSRGGAGSASPSSTPAAAPPAPSADRPPPPALPSPADLPPSATLPPTPALMLGIVRPGAVPSPAAERREQKQEKGPGKEEGPEAKGDREKARPAKGKEPKEQKAGAGEARPEPGAREARLTSAVLDTLDLLLKEIRVVRAVQEDILAALRGVPAPPPGPAAEETPSLTPIRARRRKTVVLVDDDPQTREAALAEFHQADVPVRACGDGNAALAAIAEDKPDVIILEIAITGDMEGRDVINMVKATMEWVDIPIILWTRGAVSSQKEARQLHGADEVVPKSSGPQALLARVITVFRRG